MAISWKEMRPAERLAKRLDDYVTMPGFEFASAEAEALYRERAAMIRDVFEMKEPARVPVFPAEGFFPIYNAGFTVRDALYDYDKFAKAIMGYYTEFQPDAWSGARVYVPGPCFDILDYKLYH